MSIEDIGDSVYACVAEKPASGHTSSGFIDSGGGLPIDTQFALAHATQMARLFGRIWRRDPTRVVNTHEHAAHTWGNQLFPRADVLAHRQSRARPALEGPEEWQRLRDVVDSPHPWVPPDAT